MIRTTSFFHDLYFIFDYSKLVFNIRSLTGERFCERK